MTKYLEKLLLKRVLDQIIDVLYEDYNRIIIKAIVDCYNRVWKYYDEEFHNEVKKYSIL